MRAIVNGRDSPPPPPSGYPSLRRRVDVVTLRVYENIGVTGVDSSLVFRCSHSARRFVDLPPVCVGLNRMLAFNLESIPGAYSARPGTFCVPAKISVQAVPRFLPLPSLISRCRPFSSLSLFSRSVSPTGSHSSPIIHRWRWRQVVTRRHRFTVRQNHSIVSMAEQTVDLVFRYSSCLVCFLCDLNLVLDHFFHSSRSGPP